MLKYKKRRKLRINDLLNHDIKIISKNSRMNKNSINEKFYEFYEPIFSIFYHALLIRIKNSLE